MRDFLRKTLALWCLRLVRPYFIDRSIGQYVKLTDYGFHEAFENNPQIVFESKRSGLKWGKRFLPKACWYLNRYLAKGLWTNQREAVLRRVGVAEPLLEHLDMLLAPHDTCGYNDYKKYSISPDVQKPEGKMVVYTVLTGDYDNIVDPLYVTPGVDYLVFTNREIKKKVWKTIKVDNGGLSDLMLSRRIKMLPQEYLPQGYNTNIYVDANVIIFGDITMLATKLNEQCHFAVSAHSMRNKVKEELDELVNLGKVESSLADNVFSRYIAEGFEDNLGLAECTVLVRHGGNYGLDKLMQTWWKEFSTNGLNRDQISLMYCIWKEDYKMYELMDGHVMGNQFCTVQSHKKNVSQNQTKI